MSKTTPKIILCAAFLLLGSAAAFAQTATKSPRVFILDSQSLIENKQKITVSNAALASLEKDAQKALKVEISSVVTKQATPPSGDKHDYMSQAPYFWKNPNTPDGLPYVRRDGERNPEIKKYPDHDLLDQMVETIETLSLAFYFTGKEEYAARASEILRMWFIDEKTRMNPNLEYAQAIPGVNTGRGIGIIETRGLARVVDAVGLLENSESWTRDDQKNLENWFDKYLTWLTTSKNGRDESAAKNNHGTFYDVQTASFALFVGKKDFAKAILETTKQKRFALQIAADGSQPLELERTKSWDYSTMNLDGLIQLAILGESVGVDLWNFQTSDNRSLRRAIDFLYPFAAGEKKWTTEQISPLQPERLYSSMRQASRCYKDEKFAQMFSKIPKFSPRDRRTLLLS